MADEENVVTEPVVTEPVAEEAPKYTDKQLNDLLKRDAGKEVKKLLSEFGFAETGDIKADLAKLKSLRDSQMTESDKTRAALAEKDTALTAAQSEAENAKYEAAAARLGVPEDKIDSFVKHARVSDGETPMEKMKAYLGEIGFKNAPASPDNVGAVTGAQGLSDQERMLAAARKQAGLIK